MQLNRWQINFLIGIAVLVFIVEQGFAGHHHKDDDDDDDDDPQCYPGRNCRPGCYCTSSFCRPYFPPHNQYLKRYQCTGYNYPKWKVWKKGSKHDGENSTIVVIAHHYEKAEPSLSAFLKDSNFTTHDIYKPPVPTGLNPVTVTKHEAQANNMSLTEFKDNTTTSTIIDLIETTLPSVQSLNSI